MDNQANIKNGVKVIEDKINNLQDTKVPISFKIVLYWPTEQHHDETNRRGLLRTATEFYHFRGGRMRIQVLGSPGKLGFLKYIFNFFF